MRMKNHPANSHSHRGLDIPSRFFVIFLIFCIAQSATEPVKHNDDILKSNDESVITNATNWLNMGNLDVKKNQSVHSRSKRSSWGVMNLNDIITFATEWPAQAYLGYGCYCGWGGRGIPVDGIDRCCRTHDYCYASALCYPQFLDYIIPYHWQRVDRATPQCDDKNLELPNGMCRQGICNCDVELAFCLQKYSRPRRQRLCRTINSHGMDDK